ncbi:MAG: hypothetical protein HZB16_11920 [Armatimonadetes bacterium]|nr:hypothetical protein [Armatimonadota bacterium]
MKKYFGIAVLLAIVGVAMAQSAVSTAAAGSGPRVAGPVWQSPELASLRSQTMTAVQALAQLNADPNADASALEAKAQEVDGLRAQLAAKTAAERDAYLSNGGTCPGPGQCGMGPCGSGQCGMGQCGMGMGMGQGRGQCGMAGGQGMGMGRGMGRGAGMGQGQGMGRGMRRGGGQGNGGVCPNQPTN